MGGFIYHDLCDHYVEYVKPSLSDVNNPEFLPSLLILHSCVITSLKLLHPVMPFITEELYQRLPKLTKEKRYDLSRDITPDIIVISEVSEIGQCQDIFQRLS